MELRDYLAVLRQYWRSVAAVVILGVLGAATFSLLVTPTYTSNTALFFAVSGANSASDLAQGTTYTGKQVESYVQVATSPMVLQPVIDQVRLDDTPSELAERVTVSVPTNTSVIDIAVVDTDPEQAGAIAAAVGAGLVSAVSELSPDTAGGAKSVEATIITPATVPATRTSPKVAQNLVLGLLLGVFLGAGQAILRGTLDTRVRTATDVAHVTDAPVIGQIALDEGMGERPGLVSDHPASPRAEAFRRLRTNLQFLDAGPGTSAFVFTSSLPDEGKTNTAVNSALVLADSGMRVLLIDADLRKPSVGRLLGLESAAGLSSVLIGRAGLADVVQPAGHSSVDVLTSGPIPPNPAELLGSPAMVTLLAEAREDYDVVILDAPPLLPVTDAAILSRMTSGALIVVASGEVRTPQLSGALESLAAVEARVLGVVLNKLRGRDIGYGGYYHRYHEVESPQPDVPRRGIAPQGEVFGGSEEEPLVPARPTSIAGGRDHETGGV